MATNNRNKATNNRNKATNNRNKGAHNLQCCAEVRPRPASSLGLSRPPRPATPTEVTALTGTLGSTVKAESESATEKPQKLSFAFMAVGRETKLTGYPPAPRAPAHAHRRACACALLKRLPCAYFAAAAAAAATGRCIAACRFER